MIPLNQVLLVARREIGERLRDRSYRVSILLGLFMVTVFSAVPGLLRGDSQVWRIGAVGGDVVTALGRVSAPARTEVRIVVLADRAAAERAVLDGEVKLAVVDGRLVVEHDLDGAVGAAVQTALREQALVTGLGAAGAGTSAVEAALAAPEAPVRFLDPRDPERERRARWAGIGAVVLFGQMFGNVIWVATAVTEEKASRVVELLLAKIRPRYLLTGKVLGLGALGMGQTLLTVGLGLLSSGATGAPLPGAVLVDAIGLLGWFVLGYVLFAAIFAMAGSLVARQEDLQAVTLPASFVMAASMAGVFPALADPSGPVARVLSFVPLTAPMTMPMRVAVGAAAWWEVAVAVVGVVTTCALLVRTAGRVYAGAALRTSGRLTIREALAAADR